MILRNSALKLKTLHAICFTLVLLLASCRHMPARDGTAIDDIYDSLDRASTVDRHIAGNNHIPSEVNAALLPQREYTSSKHKAMQKRFNVSVKDMPAEAFFTGLVRGTPYSVVVDPAVSGSISLDLKDVTIPQTLRAVRDVYGYEFKTTQYGFEILPTGLHTQIFSVNYLNISRAGETKTTISVSEPTDNSNNGNNGNNNNNGGNNNNNNNSNGSNNQAAASSGAFALLNGAGGGVGSPSSVVHTKSQSDIWQKLASIITSMVGDTEGRSVVVDPQAGIVVVRAYPQELAKVREYLHALQSTVNRQVILEAKILEVQLSDTYQAGINWQLLGLQQGLTPRPYASNLTADNFTSNVFTANMSAGGAFNALIKLLSAQGNVQVLSSPRVSTVNNQKAVIKVGTDEYFVTGLASNTLATAGGAANNSQNINLQPFFSGIALDVTPQIDNEHNVILHIHPSVSQVVQQVKTVSMGGTTGDVRLPLAQSTIRESDSIVRAKSGQVVVIGGLMQNNTTESTKGTPFVGDLPFVGHIFRDTAQTSQKTELVILLRPIVTSNKTWPNQMDQAEERFERVDRGFHFGNKAEVFGNLGEQRPYWASNGKR